MTEGSDISLEKFEWLLGHYDELHIRSLEKDIHIDSDYEYKKIEVTPDIIITESRPVNYHLIINGIDREFPDKSGILKHLIDGNILSDYIRILDFRDNYWGNIIDCNEDDFQEKLETFISVMDFREIDMKGLLDMYGSISTHFTLYVNVWDMSNCNDDFKKESPERYEQECRTRDLFVKCAPTRNFETFYRFLGIGEISDLIIEAHPQWYGVQTSIKWVMRITVTQRSLDWLRQFHDDFSMNVFNDLCFYREDELLYHSTSHEEMRSDKTGRIKRFKIE